MEPASIRDTSWIREFASSSQGSQKGRKNQLNLDSRFRALLQASLPQHQFFWRDHGRFTPLPDLVQQFNGVPGDVLLEENRYVSVSGCLPHFCDDRGLVWIDTAPSKRPLLIFAANDYIIDGRTDWERSIHLWLFSSRELNWQKLPAQYVSSLTKWWNSTDHTGPVPERIVVVTIVQPSGEMVDLSPSIFPFTSGATK